MNFYLCGACRAGKAEIARRLAEQTPGMKLVVDPAEAVFRPLFGHGLDRVFRGRLWEGRMEIACDGVMEYLNVLSGEPGETTVYNEGPLTLLAHLLYFGVLALMSDQQREVILSRTLSLLDQGEHYVITRWADDGTFDRVNASVQAAFGCNRANVFLLAPAAGYEETVEAALEQIGRGALAREKDVLARIAAEREEAERREAEVLQVMEQMHIEAMEAEREVYEQLEAERLRLDEELTGRRLQVQEIFALEEASLRQRHSEEMEMLKKEEERIGADDDAELQSAKA